MLTLECVKPDEAPPIVEIRASTRDNTEDSTECKQEEEISTSHSFSNSKYYPILENQ